MRADQPPPTLRFSDDAVLALPDAVTDCHGALVIGDRDRHGHCHVLCSFYPGEIIRRLRAPLAPSLPVSVILVLSPADALALARQLERSAEEAEEERARGQRLQLPSSPRFARWATRRASPSARQAGRRLCAGGQSSLHPLRLLVRLGPFSTVVRAAYALSPPGEP
jgi:hypothetical protein